MTRPGGNALTIEEHELTKDQVQSLADLLVEHNFIEPRTGWLADRLNGILMDCRRLQLRPDIGQRWNAIRAAENDLHAINLVADHLARGQLEVPILFNREFSFEFLIGDGSKYWNQVLDPEPISDADVEIARKVVARMAHLASYRVKDRKYVDRHSAVKSERPDIEAVIEGLAMIWCQATGIAPSSIKISASTSNPAMAFIETGCLVILDLKKPLQRDTIEKRVRKFRKRVKAIWSDA